MKYYLAIDIGASSGRHILGHVEDRKMILEEVYRFDNLQVRKNGHDCWDTENLWKGIVGGLKACREAGKIPETIGIDTWGVDFVLLDREDRMIGDAVAYRDSRTDGMDRLVEAKIAPETLYSRTGIQKAGYNTIYQLMALQQEHPEQLEQAAWLLMTPDYWNFRLTGVKSNEYTIATTTNLVNAREKNWDREVIEALGLPAEIFHDVSMPGTAVGPLSDEISAEVGFQSTVVMPATHDTGSAFLAIPAVDENAVYISSGTWSLLGVENALPITSPESCRQNFSNEGGAWSRYRYLRNLMGLWMIQSIRRELNGVSYVQGKENRVRAEKQWSFPDLIAEARKARHFRSWVDIQDQRFLAPESMMEAVRSYCRDTDQSVPETVGEIMQCVYLSLSRCYAREIASLEQLTGKHYTSINIVGGGCQDMYLNRCTAEATGLTVYAGPIEGTAIGNLIVQMVAGGEFADLADARDAVRRSFDVKTV